MTMMNGLWFLPACLVAAWMVARRPLRQLTEERDDDRARALFRQQREWLEARFLTAVSQALPLERARWDEAHWYDEVVWARDRRTRSLLALVGVRFGPPAFDAAGGPAPRHATALFEFRKGRWCADGRRVDEGRPDEVVLRSTRFEPVTTQPRRV